MNTHNILPTRAGDQFIHENSLYTVKSFITDINVEYEFLPVAENVYIITDGVPSIKIQCISNSEPVKDVFAVIELFFIEYKSHTTTKKYFHSINSLIDWMYEYCNIPSSWNMIFGAYSVDGTEYMKYKKFADCEFFSAYNGDYSVSGWNSAQDHVEIPMWFFKLLFQNGNLKIVNVETSPNGKTLTTWKNGE